jgi:hypothetical protein
MLGLSLIHLVPGFPRLPGDLGLVAVPATALVAAGLYLVAWTVRCHPSLELLWGVGNVVIRFVAVASLGLFLFPDPVSSGAAVMLVGAGGLAALVQFLRVGWMVLDQHATWLPARRWLQRLGVEAFAMGILWVAVLRPSVGVFLAAIALATVAIWGLPFYRAGLLALALLRAGLRHLVGGSAWLNGARLPRWVRRALEEGDDAGAESIRATRALLTRPGRGRAVAYGWLVSSLSGTAFLSRPFRRVRRVTLRGIHPAARGRGPHLEELVASDDAGELALLIPAVGLGIEELQGGLPPAGATKNL